MSLNVKYEAPSGTSVVTLSTGVAACPTTAPSGVRGDGFHGPEPRVAERRDVLVRREESDRQQEDERCAPLRRARSGVNDQVGRRAERHDSYQAPPVGPADERRRADDDHQVATRRESPGQEAGDQERAPEEGAGDHAVVSISVDGSATDRLPATESVGVSKAIGDELTEAAHEDVLKLPARGLGSEVYLGPEKSPSRRSSSGLKSQKCAPYCSATVSISSWKRWMRCA